MTDAGGSAQPRPSRLTLVPGPAALTIGELAERTGVSPAVLRMWETRHGFPVPQRMPSGHRRYSESDVEAVQRILRRKSAGVRLEVAISEAAAAARPPVSSVFAELRRRHPGLTVQRLHKRTLIALSWAIEDEVFAAASSPVVFGAFQEGRFFRPAAVRWSELARVARAAYVFADRWPDGAEQAAGPAPVHVALTESSAMRREWTVVCDGGDSTACLAAWEMPGQGDVEDRHRVFETVWTLDPAIVRDAARVAADLAADAGAAGADRVAEELAEAPVSAGPAPGAGDALFARMLAYVDRLAR